MSSNTTLLPDSDREPYLLPNGFDVEFEYRHSLPTQPKDRMKSEEETETELNLPNDEDCSHDKDARTVQIKEDYMYANDNVGASNIHSNKDSENYMQVKTETNAIQHNETYSKVKKETGVVQINEGNTDIKEKRWVVQLNEYTSVVEKILSNTEQEATCTGEHSHQGGLLKSEPVATVDRSDSIRCTQSNTAGFSPKGI